MQGLVHCDIKCDNVLVKRRPGSPLFDIKICDFGLVDRIGNVSEPWGTPCHMAPEGLDTASEPSSRQKEFPDLQPWGRGICIPALLPFCNRESTRTQTSILYKGTGRVPEIGMTWIYTQQAMPNNTSLTIIKFIFS
jgi:serine/threonine protein kinase